MLFTNIFSAAACGFSLLVGVEAYDAPTKIGHDQLSPVGTILGSAGGAIRNHQPYMHIAHGCQVYTAVDKKNHYSGGLKDTGSTNGGCKATNKGQVYVRTKHLNGKFGIMYAWYWPKDHPVAGDLVSGHRHDWESCVVWLSSSSATASMEGAACSAHGKWKKSTSPKKDGRRIKVEYFTSAGKNHELQFSNTKGKGFPIYDWARMPGIVKNVLNRANFGSANCPLNDKNFDQNMRESFVKR